ncbi:deoxyribose-phosphate aldolase [Thermotoga sp. Ku-13t]|uniref:deoxyribose-phosphate aldolase n=1 Tax=Thermotoga sp. Ku-13t TaxID=1755813 RepID=UPI001F49ADD7|nr:deoxyribose-phosphate aldolase [Thermotoga sp. Ku-13t]
MNKISKLFDSTLLSPDVDKKEVIDFINKSVQKNVRAVSVPWCYIPLAIELTSNSDVGIVVGVDFPLGYSPTEVKLAQIDYYSSLSPKITDFDVVLNLCAVKSNDWDYVHDEIVAVSRLTKAMGRVCKIIVEVSRLNEHELRYLCEILHDIEEVDYVKTGTGFGPRPTTYEDVVIMKSVLGDKKPIKVSGGIRTADQVKHFLQLGASLFGSSHAVDIISQFESEGK